MIAVRAAVRVLALLTLTACAGEQLSLGSSAPAPTSGDSSMPGRWILSAPNAPSCGLEFAGAPGARNGKIAPDGGCPSAFYMSRRWAMEGDALTITDGESRPLAQFKANGALFEGQSTGGIPVTLAR
jgi:Protease inhibitor Inh